MNFKHSSARRFLLDRRRVTRMGIAIALMELGCVAGCQIFGVAAAKLGPPEKIQAQYVLAKVPTAVIVEDYGRRGASSVQCDTLQGYVHESLQATIGTAEKPEDVTPLVPPDAVIRLRRLSVPDYKKMTIQEIGQKIGAEQIIYVDVLESSIESSMADQVIRSHFGGRVRVVSVKTGETIWPQDAADGYPIEIETPFSEAKEKNAGLVMQNESLQSAAVKISRLFYTYEKE